MNRHPDAIARQTKRLYSFLRRLGKRLLRRTLEFIVDRPRLVKLGMRLLGYFPALERRLKRKAYMVPGVSEVVLQKHRMDLHANQSREASFFFHYNATFDPQMLIRQHTPGSVKPHAKYVTNFLGLLIDPKIFPSHLTDEIGKVEAVPVPANWHADIAEWGAALRAVELSKSRYTIVEVGCGWGCWMNNTGLAARRLGRNLNLIGIEAHPVYIDFAEEMLKLNGFQTSEYKLHRGIAAAANGRAFFPKRENSADGYGLEPVFYSLPQDIEKALKSGKYDELPMISLEEIARECTRIDLLHIDIQGGEVDFIRSSLDVLSKKVAYVLIGTHSWPIESRIFNILSKAGWLLEMERSAIVSLDPEPYVTVDGVQAWRNLALLPIELNNSSDDILATSTSGETNGGYKYDTKNGLKKCTDLSFFLADLQRIEETSSPDDSLKAMSTSYLELTPAENELAKLDPYSPEYRAVALRLYQQISGVKNYEPRINERTPYIDVTRSIRSPSPYGDSSSSKVVGDYISSWGWVFQALDVRQGDKVLEYGAGEGQLSIMLARMGIDVSVIDIDERYLEAIRAQCVSLGVNVALKQGEFGDGFEDKKFDRILFFEAFHHALDHRDVIKKLKSHLTERGSVVFSGEPIVEAGSVQALFVPFPWGPRLDGLSVRSSSKFGWCELGFQQGYFVEMLMREGWLVKYMPCPVTARGNCYIATPNPGWIDLGAPYAIFRNGGDAGWHAPEERHRWTKSHAYLPLPEEFEKKGGQVTLTLANYLPVARVVKIGTETNEKVCRLDPGQEQVVKVSLSPSRYLQLRTARIIPSRIIRGSTDDRELGVAVVQVIFH